MTPKESIGANIVYFRGVRGLSLKDLAERSGLQHTYIERIEQGESTLVVDDFFKIAQALDCQPTELLLGPHTWMRL